MRREFTAKGLEGDDLAKAMQEVIFRQGGELKTYPRRDVIDIRLQAERRWDDAKRVEDIDDPLPKKSFADRVDPARFPGAGTYTHYKRTTVRLNGEGTWEKSVRRIVRILNEHGESASINSQTFRSGAENMEIKHGISVRPDGTMAHLRDTAVQVESLHGNEPRYDRVKRMRMALPEGKPGVLLDSEVTASRHLDLPLEDYYEEFLFAGPEPAGRLEVVI